MKRKFESGQALVLVLLSLSVVLTIALYILSRSVTDISSSSQQADSVRAFSAAEAGIEQALITGSSISSTIIGNASFSVDVSKYSEGSTYFVYPYAMFSGDSMTGWFVSHNTSGKMTCGTGYPCFTGSSIKICWGNTGTSSSSSTAPAIEATIFYETTPGTLSTVRVARAVIDPNSTRRVSNSFSSTDSGTCTLGTTSFAFQKTISFSDLGIPSASYNTENGLILVSIKLIYNTDAGHYAGISVSTTLPSQGLDITSTGTAGTSGLESNRKINVFQGWPEFPFAGNSLFIPAGITK